MRKLIHALPVVAAILSFLFFQNFSRVPARFLPGGGVDHESNAKLYRMKGNLRVPASVQAEYEAAQVVAGPKSPEIYLREKLGISEAAGTVTYKSKPSPAASCQQVEQTGSAITDQPKFCSTSELDENPIEVKMDFLNGRVAFDNLGPVNATIKYVADQRAVDVDFSRKLSSDSEVRVNVNPREQSGKVNFGIGW